MYFTRLISYKSLQQRQDSATPHFVNDTIQLLTGGRINSNNGNSNWPSNSCGCSNFYIWGCFS